MLLRTLKLSLVAAAVGGLTIVAQHPVPDPTHKTVPVVDYGLGPKAPSIDNYYLEGDPATFIPDEFMSNPGGEVDPTKLKGYHLPPVLRWVKIKGKRVVNAGESVQFEAQAESPVPIQRWFIAYQGPNGRQQTFRATFNPRKDNPWMHDGVVQTSRFSAPGVYIVYDGELNSELGHSKAYFAPMHPAMKGLEFEILPNPNADTAEPTLENIWIGETEKVENGRTYNINDMIAVRASSKDDKSGVSEMTLRMSGPDNKYVEVKLSPYFARPGEFIGYFKINPWAVGGEYIARTLTVGDRAGNRRETFAPTNDKLKAVRFSVVQDPKKVDKGIPRLISVAFDKATGKLGTDEVKISAIAIDDMSGVGDVYVDVASAPSYIDKKRIKLSQRPKPPLVKPGFDIEEFAWEGSFKPHALDEPGDWIVSRVFIRDKASNYADIRSTEHSDLASVKVVFADPSGSPAAAPAPTGSAPGPGNPLPVAEGQKVRRVDMTPPHPPRGPCLNCHEP